MRATHTFILRLLIDTNEPLQLRGSLHCIADDSDHPFADAQTLLDLLRHMTSAPPTLGKADIESHERSNDEQDD